VLKLIFSFSALDPSGHSDPSAGLASPTGKLISLLAENKYSTPMGKAVLHQLYNKDVMNVDTGLPSTSINLFNQIPSDGSSSEYRSGSNNFDLGGITTSMN
jgi:hypothetical protein